MAVSLAGCIQEIRQLGNLSLDTCKCPLGKQFSSRGLCLLKVTAAFHLPTCLAHNYTTGYRWMLPAKLVRGS